MIKKVINLITGLFKFSWLKKIKIKWSWFKKLFGWIKSILKETLAQTFTLLGFFIAWLTLTGTAKDIVGIAIIISISLWLLTIGFRD
jgi:hypothetical protein